MIAIVLKTYERAHKALKDKKKRPQTGENASISIKCPKWCQKIQKHNLKGLKCLERSLGVLSTLKDS